MEEKRTMSEEKKIPVVIDCDPGHDDMMALVLAMVPENWISGQLPLSRVITRSAILLIMR